MMAVAQIHKTPPTHEERPQRGMGARYASYPIAMLYRFLAQCLHYPESAWMTGDFRRELIELVRQLGAVQEAQLLEQSHRVPNLIEALQIDYTRLFINGVPHVAAPLYGAVYLDGSLQGPSTARTLAYYRERGYGMAETADLPDHLVHELEFLSYLAEQGDRHSEQEFLQQFFRAWFPAFSDRVFQQSCHVYYRTVISMIDYFTKEDE